MTAENTTPQPGVTPAKNIFAGVVAAIFVIALGYQLYNYFSANMPGAKKDEGGDIISGSTERTTETTGGESFEKGAQPASPTIEADKMEASPTAPEASQPGEIIAWMPNNYSQGSIQKGRYTVVSGDTLWEIAEGVYGDGSRWVEILNANTGSVGYLPNGSQALIVPGQQLLIP